MANNDLEKLIQNTRKEVQQYLQQWSTDAGKTALKFVDSNFASQGWKGNTLVPWKGTKSGKKNVPTGQKSQGILIKSGKLRRSFSMNPGDKEVTISTDVPYAKVHNEGLKGTVNVREYTRRVKGKALVSNIKTKKIREVTTNTGETTVKAHTANMNIPMRQFMPNSRRGSAMLNQEIKEMTIKNISKILKNIK